jgi:hypothetical protein
VRRDGLQQVPQALARDARLVRFIDIVHGLHALEPPSEVLAELAQETGDDGAEQGLAHPGVHVRRDLVHRQPLVQALARALEVALESRLELRLGLALLALESLDQPLDRGSIPDRELALRGDEPAEEDFRVPAGV